MMIEDKIPARYNRYIISRIYVVLSILCSVFIGLNEEASLYYQIFDDTKMDHGILYPLIFICSIGIIDIFVNDFLPNKYKFRLAYENRHIVYMTLSLASFSISAAMVYTYGPTFHLARLWLDGTVAAVVAILDIFARHKGNSWR